MIDCRICGMERRSIHWKGSANRGNFAKPRMISQGEVHIFAREIDGGQLRRCIAGGA